METASKFDGHETGPRDADAAIIWLHGLGADCYDFAPIADEIAFPGDWKVRFVFPNAPVRPVTLNGGMRMRSWYDIRSLDMDERSHDEAGITESLGLVSRLVARETARGVSPGRIALAGFSQGGAIAVLAALKHPDRLAGVVALSTYLLYPDRIERQLSPANRALPFFVAHGPADPVVPFAGGQFLRDRLTAMGYPVEWRTYPVPHAVHPDEIEDAGRFLAQRFSSGRGWHRDPQDAGLST